MSVSGFVDMQLADAGMVREWLLRYCVLSGESIFVWRDDREEVCAYLVRWCL